jgi:hypothetical protein
VQGGGAQALAGVENESACKKEKMRERQIMFVSWKKHIGGQGGCKCNQALSGFW